MASISGEAVNRREREYATKCQLLPQDNGIRDFFLSLTQEQRNSPLLSFDNKWGEKGFPNRANPLVYYRTNGIWDKHHVMSPSRLLFRSEVYRQSLFAIPVTTSGHMTINRSTDIFKGLSKKFDLLCYPENQFYFGQSVLRHWVESWTKQVIVLLLRNCRKLGLHYHTMTDEESVNFVSLNTDNDNKHVLSPGQFVCQICSDPNANQYTQPNLCPPVGNMAIICDPDSPDAHMVHLGCLLNYLLITFTQNLGIIDAVQCPVTGCENMIRLDLISNHMYKNIHIQYINDNKLFTECKDMCGHCFWSYDRNKHLCEESKSVHSVFVFPLMTALHDWGCEVQANKKQIWHQSENYYNLLDLNTRKPKIKIFLKLHHDSLNMMCSNLTIKQEYDWLISKNFTQIKSKPNGEPIGE